MELNDLYEIANRNNIKVMDFNLPENTAVTIEIGDGCYVGVNPAVFTSSRQEKVVIAHELGHIETGSLYSVGENKTERCKKEAKAQKWAVESLVPFDQLKEAIDKGYDDNQSLAEYFDVTEEFMFNVLLYYRKKQ
ncbi:MAG: ImmA/IrrE family metallo-endopeptidase [Ruminococcaceae bacterium]|nr:ImmA/IrrE family metallo-endopeptidase [Oscillospiraceae bacterium]